MPTLAAGTNGKAPSAARMAAFRAQARRLGLSRVEALVPAEIKDRIARLARALDQPERAIVADLIELGLARRDPARRSSPRGSGDGQR